MSVCDKCGKNIPEGKHLVQIIPLNPVSQPVYLCVECSQSTDEYFKNEIRKEPFDLSFGKAVLFGLAAAVLCSLVWYGCVIYTHFQFGFIAIAVGYFIAFAVTEGSNTHSGHQLKWISAGLTLFAMVFSQYLISHYYYSAYLVSEGYTRPSLLLPLGEIYYILYTEIVNKPASIFFWLLAISEAYILPVRWRPR